MEAEAQNSPSEDQPIREPNTTELACVKAARRLMAGLTGLPDDDERINAPVTDPELALVRTVLETAAAMETSA